ncbi:Hypothetical_protein [Hexamita inflata]|uniref:Hypothetical_protein n=1 Tax=Hexamita inflata TaxID=28002 RepID=A0AA86NK90_9EUKA|nr:Hypothetical protein HINF_LOCUS8411 [Hexamita inflata]
MRSFRKDTSRRIIKRCLQQFQFPLENVCTNHRARKVNQLVCHWRIRATYATPASNTGTEGSADPESKAIVKHWLPARIGASCKSRQALKSRYRRHDVGQQ